MTCQHSRNRGTCGIRSSISSTELLNTGDRSPEIFRRVKSMASAKALGAALLMAPLSVLASVAAWRLLTPLQ